MIFVGIVLLLVGIVRNYMRAPIYEDGDIDNVKKVLDIASSTADERYNEYHAEDED
jgi:hypothetical protein